MLFDVIIMIGIFIMLSLATLWIVSNVKNDFIQAVTIILFGFFMIF